MRLGACPCTLSKDSIAHQAYARDEISERHRHRYEFNNDYRDRLSDAGLLISGINPEKTWSKLSKSRITHGSSAFNFTQFQSKPNQAHPLFASFIEASLGRKLESTSNQSADSA